MKETVEPAQAPQQPIFHERALWSLVDIAAFSGFSTSQVRQSVVCQPGFPPAVRVTPTAHPRWFAGEVWRFFESKREVQHERQ